MNPEMLSKIHALRRELHNTPEESMHEVRTKETLIRFLSAETGLEICDCGSFFYAVKRTSPESSGDLPGASVTTPPLAFRADMDSVCAPDGSHRHLCGHDGHMSILCGLALELEGQSLPRDIFFLFQPGEETGEGARICREIISANHIGEIYGLHNIPGHPAGTFLFRENTFACASTGLRIRLTGTPSHAAYPEAGRNPALAVADLLLRINTLSEEIRAGGDFVLVTVIGMDCGSHSYGVSASSAELRLTIRGEKESVFTAFLENVSKLATSFASAGGFLLETEEIERFPATENDPEYTHNLMNKAESLGFSAKLLTEPLRWSEDFGYYLQECPGAFFGIGAGIECPQLHTATYEYPDEITEKAIALLAAVAIE